MASKPSRMSLFLRQVASGGNSTTRKIVPLGGGSRRTGRAAASAWPSLLAGAPVVSPRSGSASPGMPGISLTLVAKPSARMVERPWASWPVSTRRIFAIT